MWPFKKWIPAVGDTVLVNVSESSFWKDDWCNYGVLCTVRAVIDAKGSDGPRIGIMLRRFGKEGMYFYRLARVRKAEVLKDQKPQIVTKQKIDPRIVEEINAIQESVGTVEDLLDILKNIRRAYNPEKTTEETIENKEAS